VGTDYPVHNPTKELWVGCLAWVGPKWFRIGAVGPGETLRIPATNFDASLTPADIDRDMSVRCQRQ